MKQHLNNEMRHDILDKLASALILKVGPDIDKLSWAMANDVYRMLVPKALERRLMALPKGWVTMSDSMHLHNYIQAMTAKKSNADVVAVKDNRLVTSEYFVGFSWERKPFHQPVDSYFGRKVLICFGKDKDGNGIERVIPTHHYHVWPEVSTEMWKEILERYLKCVRDQEAIINPIDEALNNTRALLASCKTVDQLTKRWPECKTYVEIPEATRNVPAIIRVDEINEVVGEYLP